MKSTVIVKLATAAVGLIAASALSMPTLSVSTSTSHLTRMRMCPSLATARCAPRRILS